MKKITLLLYFISQICIAQNAPNLEIQVTQSGTICNPTDCTTLTAEYPSLNATNSYTIASIPYAPYPYFPGLNVGFPQFDDVYTSSIDLSFPFCFFGNTYDSVLVGSNGLLSFIPNTTFCPWFYTTTIPNTSFPAKNSIYGVFQDINITSGISPTMQVNYNIIGNYPNRKFVVSFFEVGQYQCNLSAGLQTSQIVLHETTNIIDVNVLRRVPCTTWNSGNGVIGIQNDTGTIGYAPPGRNTGAWSAQNESWRFTPSAPSIPPTFHWTLNGIMYSTSNPLTICNVPDDSSFQAHVTYSTCIATPITITSIPVVIDNTPPILNNPMDITVCSDVDAVDLTQNGAGILNGLNPADYVISYHVTLSDALNLLNPIANPTNFVITSNYQVIYVSVDALNTGCLYNKNFAVIQLEPVPPPTGITPQNVTPGQTLADLNVVGSFIIWYDAPVAGNVLPITTLLQNNTTYYASQSNVLGCESRNGSTNRLAITAQFVLGNSTFEFSDLSVIPNPVINSVIISNNTKIEKVEIVNLLGEKIIENTNNSLEIEMDLSRLSKGIYFIKVYSNSFSKNIKIIKE